jgi:hypothetical protein
LSAPIEKRILLFIVLLSSTKLNITLNYI